MEDLVLLHGFGGGPGDWVHAFDLDALRARYRVITPELRASTYRQCALDVLAHLDELGVESTLAVGTSLGAKTLLHLATIAPSRVSRMVLASATPRFPEATLPIVKNAGAPTDMSFQREELAIELFRGIPNAWLYVVPGGTHAIAFERSTRFEEHVLAFLAKGQ